MNWVNSPSVDQPLSYQYLMHKTFCETKTFVSNIPPITPIFTNSNYVEKACQTTVDEFNHFFKLAKTYVHHWICQQGYNAIENIKSKICDLQSSVDFETSWKILTRYYFRTTKPQI